MSSSSVWVQLYIEGENEPKGQPIKLPTLALEDIADLKEAVAKKLKLDAPVNQILIYPPNDEPPFSQDKALNTWAEIPSNSSGPQPLIVVAPKPPPVIQQQQQQSVVPDVERLLPLMTALPDLFREVGISRKSRLNCWEKDTMRTSGSQRSKRFRKKVINYYQRASNSGKHVRCQILDKYILTKNAEDESTGIIAAHIWKASTRGHGLQEFGLTHEDVKSARNGLFLTKGLEDAFDHQQICFLYNLLDKKNVLWVADTSLMNKTIAGSGKTTGDGSDIKFSDVHQKPLLCPPNCLPFRRLLSWHARLTLELRSQTVDARRFTSSYDNSPGRENAVIDPIARAICEIVEPGDDAST